MDAELINNVDEFLWRTKREFTEETESEIFCARSNTDYQILCYKDIEDYR
jgi:hypothetical protein